MLQSGIVSANGVDPKSFNKKITHFIDRYLGKHEAKDKNFVPSVVSEPVKATGLSTSFSLRVPFVLFILRALSNIILLEY